MAHNVLYDSATLSGVVRFTRMNAGLTQIYIFFLAGRSLAKTVLIGKEFALPVWDELHSSSSLRLQPIMEL